MVRAKLKCTSVTVYEGGARRYEFAPDYSASDPTNKAWAAATPNADFKITVGNPAAQVFEPGKYYYVDFTPVEAPAG